MTQTHRQALPKGYRLHEYQLDRVLGSGGFGLTYLGWDTSLDKPVAIKEYLPNDLAVRETDHSVMPKSHGDEDNFQWGLERFLDEARTLARFKHPNIIAVYRYFDAHNTAYIVMEFAEGETLDEVLKRGVLEEPRLLSVLMPLLDGLEEVHRGDFLHRDIKPGNIVIRPDGSPVLLDFGSARQAIGSRSRSITSVVTPGYAPIEQYDTRGNQGPWTDIYALGAVAYKAVSGETPPDVTERVRQDPMRPASEVCRGKYSEPLLNSIDWALSVEEETRPQDVASWRKLMTGEAHAPVREGSRESKPESKLERKRKTGLIAMMVVLLVTVIGGGYLYLQQAISACQASYSAGNHQSVILACQTLARVGVAEAVSVIVRSEARQEAAEEAARLAKQKAEEEEAARLAKQRAEEEEAARQRAKQQRMAQLVGPMVSIPAGEFRMGDISGVGDEDELPVHRVSVDAFELAKHEVTVAQFRRFVEATGYKTDAERNAGSVSGCYTMQDKNWDWVGGVNWRNAHLQGSTQGADHPVVCVSWRDAKAYIRWLNRELNEQFRLPSEAEWEYAARAGSASRYPFGNDASRLCQWGNVADKTPLSGGTSWSDSADCRDGYAFTAPVGSFKPNAWGVSDMIGNVWEWIEDCWHTNYQGAPMDGSAWVSGGDCDLRVLRGGSFDIKPARVRSATRSRLGAAARISNFGFRLARTL